MRPPTLTTGNFEAIWLKDLKFLAIKDLNTKKSTPHLHRAYLVTVPFILILAVCKNFWDGED